MLQGDEWKRGDFDIISNKKENAGVLPGKRSARAFGHLVLEVDEIRRKRSEHNRKITFNID